MNSDQPSRRNPFARHIACFLFAALAACAQAQTSGSVALVSDYRFRGLSLSDGRPEPQLTVAYDHPSGWYAGGFASRAVLDGGGRTQLLGYAGYSRRMRSGISWEAGATASAFSGAGRYNYGELFAGFAAGRVSGRLYFSPDYFGAGARALYAELNGSVPLGDQLRLVAHFGLAHAMSEGGAESDFPRRRADARLGVSATLGDWNAQLAWVAAEKGAVQFARYVATDPRAVVLSVAFLF